MRLERVAFSLAGEMHTVVQATCGDRRADSLQRWKISIDAADERQPPGVSTQIRERVQQDLVALARGEGRDAHDVQRRGVAASRGRHRVRPWRDDNNAFSVHAVAGQTAHRCRARDDDQPRQGERTALACGERQRNTAIESGLVGERVVDECDKADARRMRLGLGWQRTGTDLTYTRNTA